MSYILEALKKSDQKRKLGNVPDLHADHDGSGGEKKQAPRFRMVFFLAGLVLVNVLLWLIWWSPWQGNGEEKIAEKSTEQATGSPVVVKGVDEKDSLGDAIVSVPLDLPAEERIATEEPKPSLEINQKAGAEASAKDPSAVLVEEGEKHVKQTMPAEEPAKIISESVPEPPVQEPEPEPEIEVMLQRDLPDRVQERLPEMNISMHYYSNKPAARLVRINNKHLSEGEYVSDDMRLVEITSDGIILDYDGYRFLMEK